MPAWLLSPVGRFRFFAIAEAWSWAGLLVGMFFKYFVVKNELGVKVMGPIHGVLFVAYCLATIDAMRHLRQPPRVTLIGLLAAIPPFTTIWFERYVLRTTLKQTSWSASGASPQGPQPPRDSQSA
jgi:integral membrane protein